VIQLAKASYVTNNFVKDDFKVGNIITIIIFLILFLLLFKTIFEYYIKYSKKYKDFNIIKKVSKIASNNKAIVILDVIVESFPTVFFMQFAGLLVFATGMALFGNTDTSNINENLIKLFVNLNTIAFVIWICSTLITSIYYIIVYVKEMKATKTNET